MGTTLKKFFLRVNFCFIILISAGEVQYTIYFSTYFVRRI